MCLADVASSYVSEKAGDVPIEPDEIKSYTVPVSNIDIVLKNELGEMRKRGGPCVIRFHKVSNPKAQKSIT